MNKKRIISMLLCTSAVLTMSCTMYAEQLPNPTVVVDGKLVGFDDQEPVISEKGDTLIPVRGVLEAMGALVEWNAEDRSVFVKSHDNITRLLMKIDNPVMTKYTLKTVTTVDSEEITLSTAPTIMNDRTMIPFRAVSESIGATVDWDDDTRQITIKTKEYKKYISNNTPEASEDGAAAEYNPKESLPYLYLEADKTTVKKGDVITVDVKLANSDKIADDLTLSAVTSTLFYDSEKLKSESTELIVNGETAKNVLGASNPEYFDDSVKSTYLIMPTDTELDRTVNDGTVSRFTFTVLTDAPFEISISNRLAPMRGMDTSLLLSDKDLNSYMLDNYDEIYLDTAPIYFNK